tara:strand:+ start:1348 stop:1533 length:186 start_codon:yes stop_codon:yes gene_type:complete
MKIGDLVQCKKTIALIIDIDPLRKDSLYKRDKINEIVLLRQDKGGLWYACPDTWVVINETG